jgi:hypothetical protein
VYQQTLADTNHRKADKNTDITKSQISAENQQSELERSTPQVEPQNYDSKENTNSACGSFEHQEIQNLIHNSDITNILLNYINSEKNELPIEVENILIDDILVFLTKLRDNSKNAEDSKKYEMVLQLLEKAVTKFNIDNKKDNKKPTLFMIKKYL